MAEDFKKGNRDHLLSTPIKPVVEKNEKYMMMHESDYNKNKESWDKTLHRPLQNYVVKAIDAEFKEQSIPKLLNCKFKSLIS